MSSLLWGSDVRVSYGGAHAVDKVDFELRAGSITALVGPNGSGKSSLLNAISGFVSARGRIALRAPDGRQVELNPGMAAAQRARSGLGRTFQTPLDLPLLSVTEAVLLGAAGARGLGWRRWLEAVGAPGPRKEHRQDRLKALATLDKLGLADYADALPDTLSLGLQRLVELARCLVSDRSVLLMDEPFAGLESAERRQVAEVLGNVIGDSVSILLVEHNLDVVEDIADTVWAMNDGHIIATGNAQEVFSHPLVVSAYLGQHRPGQGVGSA